MPPGITGGKDKEMGRSWKTVIAIALLLVWAVGATVAFIAENARSLELANEHVRVEADYSRLREEYAELEEECDELRSQERGEDYANLALEVYADMLTQTLVHKKDDFDIETKIDEIIAREGLDSNAKRVIYTALKGWFILFDVSE